MALARNKNPNSYFGRITRLKKLFWLYFLLLIFEGALRKWVAPPLSAPLLVIRDPVGIMIIWEAYRTNKWPQRWSTLLSLVTVLMVGLFVLQIIAGNNPVLVGLFGLRSYLLPFPVLFIMGENLDEEDLLKMGACTLWLLLPMTLLEVAQYVSPSNSFLNRGAYEGGKQIGFAGAHVRASGTFSFAVGSVSFGVMAASFVFYGMVKEGFVPKWLLWAGAFALILSIPMTGSRGFAYQLAGLIACVGLSAILGVSQFGKVLRMILPVLLISLLVSQLPVFSDALNNFVGRFKSGEGDPVETLYNRMIAPSLYRIETSDFATDWIGRGLGSGSFAVSVLVQQTLDAKTGMGEDEFSHEVGEMGAIAGISFELFKLLLAMMLFRQALARAREREPLALLLLSLAASALIFWTIEQPTEQGFMVIGSAFCIAAGRMQVQSVKQAFPLAVRRQRLLHRSPLQRR